MGFFSNRKTRLIDSGFFVGLSDSHSHILAGVDDGIAHQTDSIKALDYLESLGISDVSLTPHINSSTTAQIKELMQQRFTQLENSYSGNITLHLAAEYMLDSGFMYQLQQGLRLEARNSVLVETSYIAAPNNLDQMIYEILSSLITPILAHPERYVYMDKRDYHNYKDRGCKFQLNLLSLSGFYGKKVVEKSLYMLERGMYDMAGSDLHRLEVFRHWIESIKLSTKHIDALEKIKQN